MEPKWLTEKEVADYLRVKVKTVQAWRQRGKGPRYAKMVRSVRYAKRDIDDFIQGKDGDHDTDEE